MLKNLTHVITENRTIERRGKKRASPIIERTLSEKEFILYLFLSLQSLIGDDNGFWRTDTYNTQISDILTNNAHLKVQVNYLKKNRQH